MAFTIHKKGPLDGSEYEIEGEIHADIVKGFREEALKAVSADVKMDGFRPGHIPEKIVVDRFGEVSILEEAGRMALEKHYGDIITDVKISPLGSPAVTITKVAPGEPFGFKIRTAVMPEVKLPDYKKISKEIMSEKDEVTVSDEEIELVIKDLQKQIAHNDYHIQNPNDNTHDHADLPLPEVNEEFIKKFGAFENIEAFKAKITEGIKSDKEQKNRDIKRLKSMDKIIEKSDIKMPKLLVESELNKMVSELGANVAQMGLNIEGYLKHVNKTIEQLRADWTVDAEKRAKTQLILNQIGIAEKIEPNADIVKKEVDNIMNMYKDADKTRATIYVETMLLNEEVWKLLEGQK
jgi:FKBP-type peptidyl-prolyl cis-trans isomerase (trigger factor)